jgi:hypothetical protein
MFMHRFSGQALLYIVEGCVKMDPIGSSTTNVYKPNQQGQSPEKSDKVAVKKPLESAAIKAVATDNVSADVVAASQQMVEDVERKEKQKKIKEEIKDLDKDQEELKAPSTTSEPDQDNEIIDDMRQVIKKNTRDISVRIQRSAFQYMLDQHWISEDSAQNAEEFFTIKVPKVLAKKLSLELNSALGLDENGANEQA